MKNCILGLCGCLMTLYLALILLSWHGFCIRKNELEQIVPEILHEVLEQYYGRTDTADREVELLVCSRIRDEIATASTVTVSLKACSIKDGIISVLVSERFSLPTGIEKTISIDRTVIVDREERTRSGTDPVPAEAGNESFWEDAVAFYDRYGSEAVFHPTSEQDGNILYATMSWGGTSPDVTYRTVGWKMVLKDRNGSLLQEIYLTLGGSRLALVNTGSRSNNHAQLFALSLQTVRKLLNAKARSALEAGQCRITLDACITVAEGGRALGSMNDEGVFTGEVYDTYGGIAGARPWSDTTRNSLRSYFGREVRNLFYTITLSGDAGIRSLKGTGSYCYGFEADIAALLKEDYRFEGWSGDHEGKETAFSFTVTGNRSFAAHTSYVDREPELSVFELYFSLQEAKEGTVTEERIVSFFGAIDKEDGPLTYGRGVSLAADKTALQQSFMEMTEEGSKVITVRAEDSVHHIVAEETIVHVIDRERRSAAGVTKVRFISAEFYRRGEGYVPYEEGGLLPNSIWKEDSRLKSLLEGCLQMRNVPCSPEDGVG